MVEWLDHADPSRMHAEARSARQALEEAREAVAGFFGTRSRQVIFTSGATEAIHAAVYGALGFDKARCAAFAQVEHSAVREATRRAAKAVRVLEVDRHGRIHMEALAEAAAVSGMGMIHCQLANHEVGTLQAVIDAATICREHGVILHVDAAAAAGKVPIRFDEWGVDLMTVTAHKMGGPKGVGALLVRRGRRFEPLLVGGSQERARRAGIENVAAAVGFAAVASHLAEGSHLAEEVARATRQTDRLRQVAQGLDGVSLLGPPEAQGRLATLVCVTVAKVEAEPVLIGLDQAGVAAHSGSACSSETFEPSPVLAAMGVDSAHSLRLSVGWSTTDAEVDHAVSALKRVIPSLRSLALSMGT